MDSGFFNYNVVKSSWHCPETLPNNNHAENQAVYIFEDFECTGDEVLVESSPPASPDMAARLAAPAQGGSAGGGSPSQVRELIVIPEISNSVHLHHTIQQVEVNGDSSGQSSPTTEGQHTYITVAMPGQWKTEVEVKSELQSDEESESGNGVNYHVQYVEPQEIYTQGHQTQMVEQIRTYPVYNVNGSGQAETTWSTNSNDYAAYGVVVAAGVADEAPASPAAPPGAAAAPPRMPPATVQWLLEHYETAEGVSLPRSSLYAHYLRHCSAHRLEPVNAASFGKLIRSVFVGLRTRRLGTRGNSKYHYYGIRAKTTVETSPRHDSPDDKSEVAEQNQRGAVQSVVAAGVAAGVAVSAAAPWPGPPSPPRAAHPALYNHHREHGIEFLEAVAALDTAAVERCRKNFWRRPPPELGRKMLHKLLAKKEVADWLRRAELELYQKAAELLLPDVLSPVTPQLTQSIRNFAKSVESALSAGSEGAPPAAARAHGGAAACLSAALRRYTSLNHLAQAARAVLTNHHQIHQMLSDLNRVDFRVVREQASWACSLGSAKVAAKLEQEFKATLGRGATLEQWAAWLEASVEAALAPHRHRPHFEQRARSLLLDWSFYSSLVIRELTLRSAASFGSFHLIRLLYDEYVSYLIERRVAEHLHVPPIAVMHPHMDFNEEGGEDNTRGNEEQFEDEEEDGEQDGDWEWEDDDDDDDEPPEKKHKH